MRGCVAVICSALLHVKWDTFTLSYHPPRRNLVFCYFLKANFTKEVSRELQEGFVKGLLLLFLHLSPPVNPPLFFSCILLCVSLSIRTSFLSGVSPSSLTFFFSLFWSLCFVIYDTEQRNCNADT